MRSYKVELISSSSLPSLFSPVRWMSVSGGHQREGVIISVRCGHKTNDAQSTRKHTNTRKYMKIHANTDKYMEIHTNTRKYMQIHSVHETTRSIWKDTQIHGNT